MVRTETAFAVILYDVVRRFVNRMLRRILEPKEEGRVSVREQAMESYRMWLPFGTSYGELQDVSPFWNQLWRATGCLPFGTSYGKL